jgi:phosphoribosylaminoimidazolecarboxamide formyltransferase/IMP cyclohydrolase
MTIRRALISVHDKTGIVNFARELGKLEIQIIATNGTLKILKKGGIRFVKHVSDVTEFPEILGGRVKTGHPKLIGGILALRDKKEHLDELERLGIKTIDIVVCNLHPFDPPINREVDLNSALANIDIGGPNLIRAAAKNFENVVVIANPNRYCQILQELKKKGDISFETRAILAREAFKETARYDSTIYRFLKKRSLANARAIISKKP